jgi:transposase
LSGEGKQSALWPKTLGHSDQTLHNWLKAEAVEGLRELTSKAVSAEQMEISRLKA